MMSSLSIPCTAIDRPTHLYAEDVECFKETIETTQSGLLSYLTEGIHLHTVKAANKQQLDRLEKILQQKGFLLSD